MTLLDNILDHNRLFVAQGEYQSLVTDRFPEKKLVIVTCMDTRLIELLPRAMNVKQGEAKVIKVAGAVVAHPFGSVMRSILIGVLELGATEIAVVGHYGCGMTGLRGDRILERAVERGIKPETIELLDAAGVDLKKWLVGFVSEEVAVKETVELIRRHPLMPKDVNIHGLIMHPTTGKLDVLVRGYPT